MHFVTVVSLIQIFSECCGCAPGTSPRRCWSRSNFTAPHIDRQILLTLWPTFGSPNEFDLASVPKQLTVWTQIWSLRSSSRVTILFQVPLCFWEKNSTSSVCDFTRLLEWSLDPGLCNERTISSSLLPVLTCGMLIGTGIRSRKALYCFLSILTSMAFGSDSRSECYAYVAPSDKAIVILHLQTPQRVRIRVTGLVWDWNWIALLVSDYVMTC